MSQKRLRICLTPFESQQHSWRDSALLVRAPITLEKVKSGEDVTMWSATESGVWSPCFVCTIIGDDMITRLQLSATVAEYITLTV
jgi:hypothetical protein